MTVMTALAATALIADDEDLPRAELLRMLAVAWPALQVVAECEHGPAAVEAIDTLSPDIAFLDIRMPGSSGLDVARAASGRCRVVFTTAYDSHAVATFEIDEVVFFQSDEKYTRVVTASDEAHIRKPLKEISESLDAEEFWQVHRGLVVRASAIARAQRDDLGRITLHLKSHAEKFAVSQAWAWRFKPM